MKKPIVVVLGLSRAGKDTFAKFLQQTLMRSGQPADIVKSSATMKRMLELAYRLPEGYLEGNGRYTEVRPGSTETYLDLMVKAFEHFRAIDRCIMFPRWTAAIQNSPCPILTDVRSPEEMDYVLANYGQTPCLLFVYVRRIAAGDGLASDAHLTRNNMLAQNYRHITVFNNRTLDDLADAATRVAAYILEVF
jgi:hypothetical protein